MNRSGFLSDLHLTKIGASHPLSSRNKPLQLDLKCVNSESMNGSQTARTVYNGTARSTTSNFFVPFVNERDGLGRLLNTSGRVESKMTPKAQDSSGNFIANPKGYQILDNYTVKISDRNKRNLNNILNVDSSELIEVCNRSEKLPNLHGFFAHTQSPKENDGSDSCRNHTQFKLKLSASQKNMVTMRRPVLDQRTPNKPKERLSNSNLKPDPTFLSQSREELNQLKSKNNSRYPNLGYYDTSRLEAIKPKRKNVIFSKTKLNRSELEQNDDYSITNILGNVTERSNKNFKVSGLDFTRQTSRDTKDNYWNKRNLEKKNIDTKNIDDIERDFQFHKDLKKKYDLHKIPYPHGAKLNPNSIPLEPNKLYEVARSYKRMYKLIQGGPLIHK